MLPKDFNQVEYWLRVEALFKKFTKQIVAPKRIPSPIDETFFLAVDIQQLMGIDWLKGRYLQKYTALELRLDYMIEDLKNSMTYSEILEKLRDSISFVRFVTSCPLIMTIRSKEEGGAFAGGRALYQRFYHDLSKDLVFDYYDIEYSPENSGFLVEFRAQTANRAFIILSKHYSQARTDRDIVRELSGIKAIEDADFYKIVLGEDNNIDIVDRLALDKPVIKFRLGAKGGLAHSTDSNLSLGKESRVRCTFMCPVYDDLFGKAVAPGQLTMDEILGISVL